jgi:hypothetical protein
MGVGTCAQFQGIWMNLDKMRGFSLRYAMTTPDLNVEAIRKQATLFSSQGTEG